MNTDGIGFLIWTYSERILLKLKSETTLLLHALNHQAHNLKVIGSNPTPATNFRGQNMRFTPYFVGSSVFRFLRLRRETPRTMGNPVNENQQNHQRALPTRVLSAPRCSGNRSAAGVGMDLSEEVSRRLAVQFGASHWTAQHRRKVIAQKPGPALYFSGKRL